MYCTKKISFISCLLLVLIGFSSQLKAISGAELAYECLGANQYKITLQVYRDCSDPTLPNSQTIDFNSNLCGTGSNLTLTLDSSYEISGIHHTQIANSVCNGGTLPGFELFEYSATLIFPQTCSDWIVSWTGCCRSPNITNLSTSGSSIYVEAMIDSRYLYSSPSFKRTKLPYYHANSSYNNQLKGASGYPAGMDDFITNLICPQQAQNSCLTHVAGLSAIQPLFTDLSGPLSINNIRKEMNFRTKDSVGQVAAVAITIYQIKNGDTVGYVQSDFPVIVLDSPAVGNAPIQLSRPEFTASGMFYPPEAYYNYTLCLGEVLIFSFIAHNSDGDTIQLNPIGSNLDEAVGAGNWAIIQNNNSSGFRADSTQIFVQIIPVGVNNLYSYLQKNDKKHLRIGLTDGAAPFPSCSFLDLTLSVVQSGFLSIPTLCANVSSDVQLNAVISGSSNIATNFLFRWRQISGPPVLFSDTTIHNPVITTTAAAHGDSVVLETTIVTTNTLAGITCTSIERMTMYYDSTGNCTIPYDNIIEGKVLIDTNNNCLPDSNEIRYQPDVLFLFEKGIDRTYAITNGQQNYYAHLDTGQYLVTPIVTNAPYWEACLASQLITIDTLVNPQVLDWSIEPLFYCPKLNVNIHSNTNLRPCMSRIVVVDYENTGTVDATNAYVELELESFLGITGSSISFINQGNDRYRFNLGTVPWGASGQFSISIQADCSSPINTPYTIKAHIYPDSICTGLFPNLVVEDSCGLDSIIFKVVNYSAAHAAPLMYWILENSTIVDTGFIQLGMGQGLSIQYPTDTNKVYQLVIDPYNLNYAASNHSHCGVFDSTFAEPPILYRPNNQIAYLSTIHARLIGSFDPNIKTALPVGYDSAHYIMPNIPIDYMIHFQNTGTDTAYQVIIVDTLSSLLDIGSLQMKSSSHPYTWRFKPYNAIGVHILEITFDNILLVDSLTNEPASHGFIEYHIQQQANLPNGTLLENSASIYFDFNAAIETNTVFHTVCDNCYPMQIMNNSIITTTARNQLKEQATKVYPNPTTGWLTVEQPHAQQARVEVYTVSGVRVKSLTINEQLYTLNMQELSAGTYLIRIINPDSSELFKVIKQ